MAELKAGKDYVGVGVGVMIRNSKGKFLLLKRSMNAKNERGKWCFPGGEVEFGETLFEAAKRETMEEAGIEIEPKRLLKVVDHILPEEKQHWVNPFVEGKIRQGEAKIMEKHKHDAIGWFAIEELPELTKNTAEFFNDVKQGKIKL